MVLQLVEHGDLNNLDKRDNSNLTDSLFDDAKSKFIHSTRQNKLCSYSGIEKLYFI